MINLTVTEANNTQHIIAVLGKPFTITTFVTSSTGFRWSILNKENVEKVFQITSESVGNKLFDDEGHMRIGAGGRIVWIFTPIKATECTIYFNYSRPWLVSGNRISKVTITVNEEESNVHRSI